MHIHMYKDTYVDFISAFYTVFPSKLIIKLRNLGINIFLCSWSMDFVTNRPQDVLSTAPLPLSSLVYHRAVCWVSSSTHDYMCGTTFMYYLYIIIYFIMHYIVFCWLGLAMAKAGGKSLVWDIRTSLLILLPGEPYQVTNSMGTAAGQDQLHPGRSEELLWTH